MRLRFYAAKALDGSERSNHAIAQGGACTPYALRRARTPAPRGRCEKFTGALFKGRTPRKGEKPRQRQKPRLRDEAAATTEAATTAKIAATQARRGTRTRLWFSHGAPRRAARRKPRLILD